MSSKSTTVVTDTPANLTWSNSFSRLGEAFYSRVAPTPYQSGPEWVHFNPAAAAMLGLDDLPSTTLLSWLSGRSLPEGAAPLAMLYAGHQFGHYVPQLGDGRAIMLGEVLNPAGQRWEIQLKGSGVTPYSRDGDGRAVLRSTIREYLCSEAMHGLGIPTTRALAMIRSEDEVYREQIEPGAMLTRLAPSHVRFGSFEVFFYRSELEAIRTLADYVISHHYPELLASDAAKANPYLALLSEVTVRTARLIAQWQAVGFAHGVMNSDNMSILGITLDYGPFGFMEAYQPGYICNHSDYSGRYAFDQQPQIGLFNLSCLAQALLPLLHDSPDEAVVQAKAVLDEYQGLFIREYAALMRAKLGLLTSQDEDQALLSDLLDLMQANQVDYTILFRRLGGFVPGDKNTALRDLFLDREGFDHWAARYAARLAQEHSNDTERCARMHGVNPKYILRNYMAELAIRKAQDERDYSLVDDLFRLLQQPFAEQPEFERFAGHPPEWAGQISVSCSS
ncbi:MAG: YdiU family protein [Gammaproteobacteria bacterium]|nr:YdiU family protein [Gammaproteobacteria bacterium]MDH5654215.1 YdiU family protein [Gammaproteobacteria bacterium]